MVLWISVAAMTNGKGTCGAGSSKEGAISCLHNSAQASAIPQPRAKTPNTFDEARMQQQFLHGIDKARITPHEPTLTT